MCLWQAVLIKTISPVQTLSLMQTADWPRRPWEAGGVWKNDDTICGSRRARGILKWKTEVLLVHFYHLSHGKKNICRDSLQSRISGFLIKHSHFTVGVCPNAQMRSLQRWNWACGDNASLVQWDVQTKKKKKAIASSLQLMRSRLALGRSAHAAGSGTEPNHGSISALTAPRGRRRRYAETEKHEEEGETDEERKERGRCR